MSEQKPIGHAIFFLGVGIWLFFRGFRFLRRKRKIENIPTSTVRSLAIGLVELIGKAKKNKTLHSPLTKTDCVFYRYTVERYQNSGKSGHWVMLAEGNSCFCPFWLDDGTGKVLVSLEGAEYIIKESFNFQTGLGKTLPLTVIDFMEANHLGYKSFLGHHRLRFKEWRIHSDQIIYVLGTASNISQEDFLERRKEKLLLRIQSLKDNPQEMMKVDANKDGDISASEWNAAVSHIEQNILQEEINNVNLEEQSHVMIDKGDKSESFIVSDASQKDLIARLSWQAFGGIFGGAILSLAMLGYLLLRFNH